MFRILPLNAGRGKGTNLALFPSPCGSSSFSSASMMRPELSVFAPVQVQRRAIHGSASVMNTRSPYKYNFRPDLRNNKPTEAEKKDNYEEWKKKFQANATWYKEADPDQIEKKWAKMIATRSHKLPNFGFRMGMLHVMLLIASKPSHLRIVQQALSLIQQHDQTKYFDPGWATLFCRASARINAPEIGLSFLQMPWLKIWPSLKALQVLLQKYAEDSEKYFLKRLCVGKQPVIPDYLLLGKTDDEPEIKAAKEEKKIDLWLTGFTETYKELRSDRHAWKDKVDWITYSFVIRTYASLGDIDAAMDIFKIYGKATGSAFNDLLLGLVYHGRAAEALLLYEKHHSNIKSTQFLKGIVATQLALNDSSAVLKILKTGQPDRLLDLFETHFGKEDRQKILRHSLNTLIAEGGIEIPQSAIELCSSFPSSQP